MEVSMRKRLSLLMCILAASAPAAYAAPICRRGFKTFLRHLNSQCPPSIPFSPSPILVDGGSFEEALSSAKENEYTAVLFYASWCPLSSIFRTQFSSLSSLYPQIKHVMVEQSSAMPSVFSRYGIHSVPSLLIVHHTTPTRFHGQKDLPSLTDFYKSITGMNPVVDLVEDASSDSAYDSNVSQLWNVASLKETFTREPYLLLSIAFVLSRAFLYFFPGIASCLKALWVSCIPHLNLGIFGESRQLLCHALHLIDFKRMWYKINACKTRNFHKGARNARVWASSLASVSLGETSSSRVLPCK
ncbi:5'-adenylylsulfate reductase-like 5 [Primulina tabacum]|uniref:5'-adenylylsulfate reductase-like 5 n=1 Tax=Primulina tabacum TaxID=48773 RepID=UPI003F5940D7